MTSSKKTYATCHPSQDYSYQKGKPLLTHASKGDTQTLKDTSGWVYCGGDCSFHWVLVHTRFVCALGAALVGIRSDSKCDSTLSTVLLWLFLCPWTWAILSSWIPTSLVHDCSAASWDFGVLAGEDEHTISTPPFFLFDKENVKIQFCVPTTSYPLVSTKFLHKYVPGTYFLSLHYYGGFVLCHIRYAGNTFPIVLFSA